MILKRKKKSLEMFQNKLELKKNEKNMPKYVELYYIMKGISLIFENNV
jgi:hypothetical protein